MPFSSRTELVQSFITAKQLLLKMQQESDPVVIEILTYFQQYCECNIANWIIQKILEGDQTVTNKINKFLNADFEESTFPLLSNKQMDTGGLISYYCDETGVLHGLFKSENATPTDIAIEIDSPICPPAKLRIRIIPDIMIGNALGDFKNDEDIYPVITGTAEIKTPGIIEYRLRPNAIMRTIANNGNDTALHTFFSSDPTQGISTPDCIVIEPIDSNSLIDQQLKIPFKSVLELSTIGGYKPADQQPDIVFTHTTLLTELPKQQEAVVACCFITSDVTFLVKTPVDTKMISTTGVTMDGQGASNVNFASTSIDNVTEEYMVLTMKGPTDIVLPSNAASEFDLSSHLTDRFVKSPFMSNTTYKTHTVRSLTNASLGYPWNHYNFNGVIAKTSNTEMIFKIDRFGQVGKEFYHSTKGTLAESNDSSKIIQTPNNQKLNDNWTTDYSRITRNHFKQLQTIEFIKQQDNYNTEQQNLTSNLGSLGWSRYVSNHHSLPVTTTKNSSGFTINTPVEAETFILKTPIRYGASNYTPGDGYMKAGAAEVTKVNYSSITTAEDPRGIVGTVNWDWWLQSNKITAYHGVWNNEIYRYKLPYEGFRAEQPISSGIHYFEITRPTRNATKDNLANTNHFLGLIDDSFYGHYTDSPEDIFGSLNDPNLQTVCENKGCFWLYKGKLEFLNNSKKISFIVNLLDENVIRISTYFDNIYYGTASYERKTSTARKYYLVCFNRRTGDGFSDITINTGEAALSSKLPSGIFKGIGFNTTKTKRPIVQFLMMQESKRCTLSDIYTAGTFARFFLTQYKDYFFSESNYGVLLHDGYDGALYDINSKWTPFIALNFRITNIEDYNNISFKVFALNDQLTLNVNSLIDFNSTERDSNNLLHEPAFVMDSNGYYENDFTGVSFRVPEAVYTALKNCDFINQTDTELLLDTALLNGDWYRYSDIGSLIDQWNYTGPNSGSPEDNFMRYTAEMSHVHSILKENIYFDRVRGVGQFNFPSLYESGVFTAQTLNEWRNPSTSPRFYVLKFYYNNEMFGYCYVIKRAGFEKYGDSNGDTSPWNGPTTPNVTYHIVSPVYRV